MQHPDGSFESYLRLRGDERVGGVSLYYPGEAMLGLARAATWASTRGSARRPTTAPTS